MNTCICIYPNERSMTNVLHHDIGTRFIVALSLYKLYLSIAVTSFKRLKNKRG